MVKNIIIITLMALVFILAVMCKRLSDVNMGYVNLLQDPHHCVSVCVEAFEKMGC